VPWVFGFVSIDNNIRSYCNLYVIFYQWQINGKFLIIISHYYSL
jgi:hypothetical protein